MVDDASQRPGLHRPGMRVWYAPPDAADAVVPSALQGAARDEYGRLQRPGRRLDWRSSRALLQRAAPGPGERHSLSHTHGHAALAAGPADLRLGVDLEWLAARDYVSMATLAFAAGEAAWLEAMDDESARRDAFYTLWTLKEACAKALGLGLLDALRTCSFIGTDGRWRGTLPLTLPWRAAVYAPRPELRLAVVWMGEVNPVSSGAIDTIEWPGQSARWPIVCELG
jgi:4'-phosphopantetheinyl transferase